jgi:hypothetical protein
MLEFVQRVRSVSRTGSSGSLQYLLRWMEVCLWRISEVPLTTFDSCLWLQNGLWQAIRAVFMSSHNNCKYTIGIL